MSGSGRTEMSVADFRAALSAQGVPKDWNAFICPACGTVQALQDHINAGMSREAAERQIAFSCVGRSINAPGPRDTLDGKPCNWTLGGLLQIHDLVVVDTDGKKYPMFALASPKQAQENMKKKTT